MTYYSFYLSFYNRKQFLYHISLSLRAIDRVQIQTHQSINGVSNERTQRMLTEKITFY